MTTSRIPAEDNSFTTPVIDYEPPPTAVCPARSPAALHRRTARPLRPALPPPPPPREMPPPRTAAVFADAALRRVLEVIDRRRPIAQLRPLVTPALVDMVVALTRTRNAATATLRRVRLRTAGTEPVAAEVFATYTRGERVHAIAARVEHTPGVNRWQIVALQIG